MQGSWQRRCVVLIAGAASAVIVALAIVSALDAAGLAQPRLGMDILPSLVAKLQRVSSARPGKRVIVLGDSTTLSAGGHLDQRLGGALRSLAPGRPVQPVGLLYPGLGPLNYYALVDQIAATHPSLVVLAFSLGSFTPPEHVHYPELVGWIAPDRLANALTLPLGYYGIPVDRLLLYVGLVQGRMVDTWETVRSEQARTGKGWEHLQDRFALETPPTAMERMKMAIARAHISRWTQDGSPERFNRAGAVRAFGVALNGIAPDHPALRVLESTVGALSRLGIATLVYIIPVDVEHLEALGIDTADFGPTIATVQASVRAAGGKLIDLHGLLPDDSFRDANHFDVGGEKNGIGIVARALAPHVLAALRARHGMP